jgi:hypothetical protein
MKIFASKNRRVILFLYAIIYSIIFVSCGQDNKGHDHDSYNEKTAKVDSSIIRTGEIDLVVIDVNGDGMVYQDPMDWNVISDDPGKCPLCGMKLKEVTLTIAKENLIKHSFDVKAD